MYILIVEGVYRHEILGVFNTFPRVVKAMKRLEKKHKDDGLNSHSIGGELGDGYHTIDIYTLLPNRLIEDVIFILSINTATWKVHHGSNKNRDMYNKLKEELC